MSNWEIAKEAEAGIGLYVIAYKFGVRHKLKGMVDIGSTNLPQLTTKESAHDGADMILTKKRAQYATLVDGAFVAAPDDALTVWHAKQKEAAQ